MVYPRLDKPVFLPCCCSCIATSLLDAGWVMERRERKCLGGFDFCFSLKHGVYRRTRVEEWLMGSKWTMMNRLPLPLYKPRGLEVRKSSNLVITVLFLFLLSVRAAGGWKSSGVILDEWQHTLLQLCHMPFLRHPTCTRELANERFAAWKRYPT